MSGPDRGAAAAGFRALSHGKLIVLLALTTAALGVTGALPLQPALRAAVGGTLAGDHFLRNHPTFAPTDFFDLLREQAPAFRGARRSAAGIGLLGIFLQIFFAGGIVGVLGRGPFSFGQFFEPARRSFWHNVKCFFLFAIFAGVALGIWLGALGALIGKGMPSVPPDAAIRTVLLWVEIAGALLLFGALALLYDFARAARRYASAIGAWRAYRFARRALSGSWAAALGLFLLWLLLGGIAGAALFGAVWSMKAVSRPAIALLFALQIAVFLVRSAARVAAWGSYIAFLGPRALPALASLARVRYRVADPAPAPFVAP